MSYYEEACECGHERIAHAFLDAYCAECACAEFKQDAKEVSE